MNKLWLHRVAVQHESSLEVPVRECNVRAVGTCLRVLLQTDLAAWMLVLNRQRFNEVFTEHLDREDRGQEVKECSQVSG